MVGWCPLSLPLGQFWAQQLLVGACARSFAPFHRPFHILCWCVLNSIVRCVCDPMLLCSTGCTVATCFPVLSHRCWLRNAACGRFIVGSELSGFSTVAAYCGPLLACVRRVIVAVTSLSLENGGAVLNPAPKHSLQRAPVLSRMAAVCY